MQTTDITVEILPERLERDTTRTIARFLWPGTPQRARSVVDRVFGLDGATAAALLRSCLDRFGDRYDDLPGILKDHYEEAADRVPAFREPTDDQRLLIGAYFTMEYTYASAAFFNPSMVAALDQTGVAAGCKRFLMSLRAVGEGHVSSIVFRAGVLDEAGGLRFDPVPQRSRRVKRVEDRSFRKDRFRAKLIEAGAYTDFTGQVLVRLDDEFALSDLAAAIEAARPAPGDGDGSDRAAEMMMWLAHSNYRIDVRAGDRLSEIVIFPISENESNGLEDMRLVRFEEDDGTARYFGTYTAYNGSSILPQILEARGDGTAEVHTLGGRYAVNKGMALFPRRLGGRYMMISRHDGENMYLLTSDNVRFWNEAVPVQVPRQPWEFVQIGNCGSPLETDAGWLLLTHGVGPMRQYSIGATLLDAGDPSRILGQLEHPLLVPAADERGGYVPNVVYSCGGMIHRDRLIVPYGIGDVETAFASVSLLELLEKLCG